jgi:hypothetical protein
MEWLTGLVSLLGVLGILMLGVRLGMMVFLVVALLYPDFMRLYLGTVEINPHRIMITLLLGMCLATPDIRQRFRWNRLDTAVTIATIVYAITLLFTTAMDEALKNRAGDMMDTLFVYLVVRMLVTDRTRLVSMIKVLGILLIPLAALSLYESATTWNPYATLANYSTHTPHDWVHEMRYGFYRAGGPWVSPIMFGLLFVSVIPLLRLLRYEPAPWKGLSYALCAVAVAGMLGTLSSGPYMMLMVVGTCLWLERYKSLVRPILIVGIVGCLLVEGISNRHFYDVLADRLAMDSGNAWYRSQLMRRAFEDLPNYWMAGYGFADPGWGVLIDERATDGCNDYVAHAAAHGLPGLFAFLGVLVTAMYTTVKTHSRTTDPWLRAYAWALGSIMVGMILAFVTVSPFKIMITVFYIVLGLQGSLSAFATARPAPAQRRSGARPRRVAQPVLLLPQARHRTAVGGD